MHVDDVFALQLNELFTEAKRDLEETAKELESTAKTLTETAENLRVTENHLSRTTRQRDEQCHLVHEHVKTEQKLYTQATQVILVVKKGIFSFHLF